MYQFFEHYDGQIWNNPRILFMEAKFGKRNIEHLRPKNNATKNNK